MEAIAIFCTGTSNTGFVSTLTRLINSFSERGVKIYLNVEAKGFLELWMQERLAYYDNSQTCSSDIDFVISLGGDGTFLKTVECFSQCEVPIVGVNAGRLGFLADIPEAEIEKMVRCLQLNEFEIEKRVLLEIETEDKVGIDKKVALNEVTVQKTHSSHFLNIHTYINGEYLTTYWSDGLIIATPTGSTAYSLSLGGPILNPKTKALVVNPIAPHTLTARPIVVPDDSIVCVLVEGRQDEFLVSLDSQSYILKVGGRIIIRKSSNTVPVVKLNDKKFYDTLRNKLMWGADSRN